jgi:hypothetical protein
MVRIDSTDITALHREAMSFSDAAEKILSIIRRWLKRKRKSDKPIKYSSYFYTETELQMLEACHILAVVCKEMPTAREATVAFMRVFSTLSIESSSNNSNNPSYDLHQDR